MPLERYRSHYAHAVVFHEETSKGSEGGVSPTECANINRVITKTFVKRALTTRRTTITYQ